MSWDSRTIPFVQAPLWEGSKQKSWCFSCLDCKQGDSDPQQSRWALRIAPKALGRACRSFPSATAQHGDSHEKVPRVLKQLVPVLPAQTRLIAVSETRVWLQTLGTTSAPSLERVSKQGVLWSIFEERLPIKCLKIFMTFKEQWHIGNTTCFSTP